jgi:hypothetical protein
MNSQQKFTANRGCALPSAENFELKDLRETRQHLS